MYDFGRNPYDRISSMKDVREFTEAVIILSIDELVDAIPDRVMSLIPPSEAKTFLLYAGNRVKPVHCFSNEDRIFERSGNIFVPVPLQEAFGRKDLYLEVRSGRGVRGFSDGVFRFDVLFGDKVTWIPELDKRLVSLAAQVVALELGDILGSQPVVNSQLLSKEAITSYLSYDLWREYQLASGTDLGEESQDIFNKEVVDVFRYLPNSIRDTIQNAGMRYGDCDATIDVLGSGLHIRFGIDKKLIPYYEKKFDEAY